jgi:hypothetical protein
MKESLIYQNWVARGIQQVQASVVLHLLKRRLLIRLILQCKIFLGF